jgi:hypothetical protein
MGLCCFFAAICAAHASDDSQQPRRQDFGDLTLLDVYGSYYEMGRQQMQLLGDEGRKQFEFQCAAYKSRTTGFRGRTFDFLPPVGAWVESLYDDSGLIDESRGFASGIGLRGSDGLRFLLGSLPSGSTGFAATRSATADGRALIGRNVDWADGDGRLRPVLVRFHPNNGDLAYMTAGWALSGGGAASEGGQPFQDSLAQDRGSGLVESATTETRMDDPRRAPAQRGTVWLGSATISVAA